MKAENKTTNHNRTIRLSEIPMPAGETAGASPLLTELEIYVNYTEPRDGRNGQRAVTLDKYAIPAMLAAINGERDDVGAEILFRSASNYEPHYRQIVQCVKALRHIMDSEAERVAIANAAFANDPATEDYDRMHLPAAEQYPRESRDNAIVDLVRHFLNELKPVE